MIMMIMVKWKISVQDEVSTSTIALLHALSQQILCLLFFDGGSRSAKHTNSLTGRITYDSLVAAIPIDLKFFHKEMLSSEISLDEALFMLSSHKLGHAGYTNLRQELKTNVDLPDHYRLM